MDISPSHSAMIDTVSRGSVNLDVPAVSFFGEKLRVALSPIYG